MNYLPLAAFVVLLISCAGPDEGNPPPDGAATPIALPKDSGLIQQPAANPYVTPDISPVDIAYFPADYSVKRMSHQGADEPLARVIYSRPHRQNRTIFGGLLKWGEPWRLGANEATEIELFKDVTIQGKRVPKGRYVLYGIPEQEQWTLVFNSNTFSWGLRQDPKNDLFRFVVPVQQTPVNIEFFTMVFEPAEGGSANLLMAWDNTVARLPIQF